MRTAVRAISVDVDGTLYRVRRLQVAWRLRHERGLLLALMAARERIRHEGAFDTWEALEEREVELVAPSFRLSRADAARRLADLRRQIPHALTRGVRPHGGVQGALQAAASHGLKLAVLSDYEAAEKLAYLGLANLPWAASVAAEACGALKPHERAYMRLAELLDLPPEAILHIGDREEVDVEGAKRAGMRAWRFSERRAGATAAERVFSRWRLDLFRPLWEGREPGAG